MGTLICVDSNVLLDCSDECHLFCFDSDLMVQAITSNFIMIMSFGILGTFLIMEMLV